MGDNTMVANNSYMSTGFMHAGLFGIIFYNFIVVYILKLIDMKFDKNNNNKDFKSYKVLLAFISLPIFQLFTSSDLFTTLLTHGLGISILIYSFYPIKKIKLW